MSTWSKMVDADKRVTAAMDRLTDIRCQLIPEHAADELETMAKGIEAIANLLEANRQAARDAAQAANVDTQLENVS